MKPKHVSPKAKKIKITDRSLKNILEIPDNQSKKDTKRIRQASYMPLVHDYIKAGELDEQIKLMGSQTM